MTPLRIEVNRENHGKRGLTLSHLVPQKTYCTKGAMSVTAKAEQANEHDGKQEDPRNQRDNYCLFGDLNVKRHAEAAGSFPCITELSEGLAQKL
jgi:hypothetical protein